MPRLQAVLAIAIDNLDSVVASLGPTIGQRLIDTAANRIAEALPEIGFPERLGSNELVVSLTEDIAPRDPIEVAGLLADLLERSYVIAGNLIDVTARIGIALMPPEGADREQMIRRAALALSERHGG